METIYLILLFIAPGIFVRQIRLYMKKERMVDKPSYEYLFGIVLDSIIVDTAAVTMLHVAMGWNVETISELIETLMEFRNLVPFTATAIVVAFIWYELKFRVVKPGMLKVKNRTLIKKEHVQHVEGVSLWDVLIEKEGIQNTWNVVSIYKDDKYIMSGMIEMYGQPGNKDEEIALIHEKKVEEIKEKHPEWFTDWYDYYNVTTGMRVKFYEQSKIQEHWGEYFKE